MYPGKRSQNGRWGIRHLIWKKLIALSDLFEISLDELVMDKISARAGEASTMSEMSGGLARKVLTDENRRKAKRGLQIAAIVFGILVMIEERQRKI